ncbi:MAG TPA: hypothetical protein VLM05_11425 [Mycobacteriales bacterium]|nr:hypothetical protein [Mycobacteriales bacterium]
MTSTVQTRPARGRGPLTGGQIAMIVIGAVTTLIGVGLLLAATAVAVAGHSRADGFLTTRPATLATGSYAVTVPDVGVDVRGPDEAYARGLLGTVRIRATGSDPAKPVFVGIARTADVDGYLRGVAHADVSDIDGDGSDVRYTDRAGSAPASGPGELTFWDRSDSGTATRTLEWDVSGGDWTVVVMNADGSPAVSADVDLGGTLPVLRWATGVLFALGAVFFLGGLLLIVLPLATRRRAPRWTNEQGAPGTGRPGVG